MFVKDCRTNIIINTDDNHYQAILSSREAEIRNKAVCSELAMLKNELSDIRNLLQKVITK